MRECVQSNLLQRDGRTSFNIIFLGIARSMNVTFAIIHSYEGTSTRAYDIYAASVRGHSNTNRHSFVRIKRLQSLNSQVEPAIHRLNAYNIKPEPRKMSIPDHSGNLRIP